MENLLINDNQDITLTEKEILEQSKNSVRTVSDNLLRTKAYYNALAANAVMHYLREKGLLHGDIVNMHSCSKMLVDFEIADIQLPNLYIDVRAVFNENEIFIPKKHFENKILPDIYLIVKFDDDLINGTLLGFVEPAKINKQNQNEEYYFVNKSILTSPSKLPDLIHSLSVKPQHVMSESAELAVEKLIMLYMDHDIDDLKLEKLIDYLKNSTIAREKLIEFENFERLSYMALQEFKDLDLENNDFSKYLRTLVATDEFAQFEDKSDDLSELFGEEKPQPKGLFVDDVIETAAKVDSAVEETGVEDEENLPLIKAEHDESAKTEPVEEEIEADVFEDIDEAVVSEENAQETIDDFIEESDVEEVAIHEEDKTNVLDEFDEFETGDEFDINDELRVEGDSSQEITEELVESVAEEPTEDVTVEPLQAEENQPDTLPMEISESQEAEGAELLETISLAENSEIPEEQVDIVTQDDNLSEPVVDNLETGESIDLESLTLDEDAPVEEESLEIENIETPLMPEIDETPIAEEDNISHETDGVTDSLSEEALDVQVEDFEPVVDSLSENVEISEEPIDEISLEVPENITEDIITDVSDDKKEETKELDVAQALDLDTVNLDSDTVIGLSEGIMDVKDVEEVSTSETTDQMEALSVEELDNIDFDIEPDTQSTPEQTQIEPPEKELLPESVDTVTDEDIDNAIAQSNAASSQEEKEKNNSSVSDDIDLLVGAENSSDADNLSLEELLSMENDLSSATDHPGAFHFEDLDEEEQTDAQKPKKGVAASAEDLELLAADLDSDSDAVIKDENPNVEDSEDEDISDFAFAVDSKSHSNSKNILVPVAALITVLGLAGAGAWYYLSHGKSAGNGMDIDNIGTGSPDIDLNKIGSVEDSVNKDIQLNGNAAAVPVAQSDKKTADKAAPAPKTPADNTASAAKNTDAAKSVPEKNPEAAAPEPLTIQKIKKDFSQPNTYLSVSKIVWDVPEYLTYNDDFNNYLQTLGSTLKLNLSSDLLLISENTVFNKVKVKIELKDSGKKYSAELAEGCGAQVVDDLVLQSVKNTLNLLKPPVNSLETADEELYITIYL